MKKAYLVITSLVIFSQIALSQNIRFGIDPGLAISRGSYKPDAGIDRRVYAGFDGGMFVEFGVAPKFMIRPEANYSMIGVELNNGITEGTIKLRYVTIPVLAKANVCGGFNLLAGPQLGLLTAGNFDPSGNGASTDIKEDFKSTDFGLVLGAEYKFGGKIFLGTRYVLGLQQIAEDGHGFEMKNRYISFRVGYIF